MESTPLVVLWLTEVQLGCIFLYQMFDEKYVFLSGDDLSFFIIWVKVLRDQYRTDVLSAWKVNVLIIMFELKVNLANMFPSSIS